MPLKNEIHVKAYIDGEVYEYRGGLPPRREVETIICRLPLAGQQQFEARALMATSRRKRNHFVRSLALNIARQFDKLATDLEKR